MQMLMCHALWCQSFLTGMEGFTWPCHRCDWGSISVQADHLYPSHLAYPSAQGDATCMAIRLLSDPSSFSRHLKLLHRLAWKELKCPFHGACMLLGSGEGFSLW